MTCRRVPTPSWRVAKASLPVLRTKTTRPGDADDVLGLLALLEVTPVLADLGEGVGAGDRHGIGLGAGGEQAVALVAPDPQLLGQVGLGEVGRGGVRHEGQAYGEQRGLPGRPGRRSSRQRAADAPPVAERVDEPRGELAVALVDATVVGGRPSRTAVVNVAVDVGHRQDQAHRGARPGGGDGAVRRVPRRRGRRRRRPTRRATWPIVPSSFSKRLAVDDGAEHGAVPVDRLPGAPHREVGHGRRPWAARCCDMVGPLPDAVSTVRGSRGPGIPCLFPRVGTWAPGRRSPSRDPGWTRPAQAIEAVARGMALMIY